MYLSGFSSKVTLVVRSADLRKSMSSYLSERVELNPRINIQLHTELRAVEGTVRLEKVHLENMANGQTSIEDSGGVFIFIGATPCTGFLGDGALAVTCVHDLLGTYL